MSHILGAWLAAKVISMRAESRTFVHICSSLLLRSCAPPSHGCVAIYSSCPDQPCLAADSKPLTGIVQLGAPGPAVGRGATRQWAPPAWSRVGVLAPEDVSKPLIPQCVLTSVHPWGLSRGLWKWGGGWASPRVCCCCLSKDQTLV